MRKGYPTDTSDAEWTMLEPYFPAPEATGRPGLHTSREILNAIFYILRSGCAWRLLPRDFPPWKTVHHYFRIWLIDGTWEKVNAALRERLRARDFRRVPEQLARDFRVCPSEAMIRRWCHEYAESLDFACDYQSWVIEGFSGVLCVDEAYQGQMALFVAIDPAAPDGDRLLGYQFNHGACSRRS